jgi:Raf kinase inhibitor-like YbhB/YbcL family protein
MKISSPAFNDNESIPSTFTCDGMNISPELRFSDIPATARALVFIMDDPDVPTAIRSDGMFIHWVLYDIDGTATGIPEGGTMGTSGVNTTGEIGYIGPCPPDREHRYFFKLYALDRELDLPEGKTKDEVITAMRGHIIAEATLIGRYNRQGM